MPSKLSHCINFFKTFDITMEDLLILMLCCALFLALFLLLIYGYFLLRGIREPMHDVSRSSQAVRYRVPGESCFSTDEECESEDTATLSLYLPPDKKDQWSTHIENMVRETGNHDFFKPFKRNDGTYHKFSLVDELKDGIATQLERDESYENVINSSAAARALQNVNGSRDTFKFCKKHSERKNTWEMIQIFKPMESKNGNWYGTKARNDIIIPDIRIDMSLVFKAGGKLEDKELLI